MDDEALLARALKRVLGNEWEVFIVANGLEALQVVSGGARFAAILSDLRMPIMSGFELFRELEAVAPDQADRIVFMTGDVGSAEANKFLSEVSNLRVEKPIDIEEIRSALRLLMLASSRAA